jgi:uncharacterized protein YbaA (DUF1428 family)
MNYIDGFIVAVPTASRDTYLAHARAAAQVFKEHGALNVVECWGDDVPEALRRQAPDLRRLRGDPGRLAAASAHDDRLRL